MNHDVSNNLSSLEEQDETTQTPKHVALKSITSSPSIPRTPATEGRVKPPIEEMHPSKVHQSTTKEPDSGLLLGFVDIPSKSANQPSGIGQQTPTRTPSSSTFDFRFARATPKLGPDAQRMMDDLREEALRIKARLAAEREQEKSRNENEASENVAGRRIAQPKGKVGRFSDAHMEEFRKMDSIAGHASAYRTQPDRFTPGKHGLKRTQSKAQLDDKSGSQSSTHATSITTPRSERIDTTAPAKRARKHIDEDASSMRPISRDGPALAKAPAIALNNRLGSVSTPTKASISQAPGSKSSTSLIPTLSRSPSKPSLATASNARSPVRPTTSGVSRSPGKLARMKSILRYPSSNHKNTGATSCPFPTPRAATQLNLNKPLPQAPTPTKHVTFPSKESLPAVPTTPSPRKSAIPRSTSRMNLGKFETTSSKSVQSHISTDDTAKEVVYPSLEKALAESGLSSCSNETRHPPPSVPGSFTFRSDKTIEFGSSPKGFGSSSGQASVRQVRPSVGASPAIDRLPPTPQGKSRPLPAVPHGMPNKKRHRADSDEENEEPGSRSPKKHKTGAAAGAMLLAPRIESGSMTPKSKTPSPIKKKGVLSLSRLNMLARPKIRK